ncbi:MAG: hypothetical protein O7J95_00060, partial [Planctomycetota bacterium]|nr:hypothetical protein [Planctomycetota bacterium]
MSPLESAKSPAPEVRRALVRYRRRRRRAAALRGLGITLTATLLSLFASLVLDRFWILGTELRVGLTALTLSVGGLLALALVLWPLLRPLSRRSLARAVERLRPELEGALLSVVELHDGDERDRRRCSRVLLERLVDSTDERAARLDVGELVDRRPSRRALAAAALALLPLGGFVASDAEGVAQLARRFLQPSLDLPRPTSVVLEVLPGDCFVRREDDVELTVRWLRGEPRAVTLLEKREGDAWRRTTVDARGAASPIFRLEDVTSPVVYRVRAGDFESPLYRVTPREPPRPVSFHITYRFPAYSGLVERRVESPTGDLSALAGSVAEVAVSIDRDIARASFRVGDGERRPATVAGRRVTLGEIPIERDGAYRLELEDREGVRSDSLAEYAIRSERDAPPRVEILQPREAEIPVEPTSRLEILYRAEDDLGLAAIDWVSEGDEPRIVPLEVRETGRGERHLLEDTWVLNTAPLGLRPGSTLTFHLRARDFHGQEARSAPRTLRVRFLPPPPEGKDWLARLGGISRDLELLERLWTDLAPPAPPGDSVVGAGRGGFTAARFGDAMDRAAAWRARAQHAGERARDLAMSLGPPGVERETLLALEFHLWNIGSDEARRFWNLAARVAAELESQDEEARWAAARIAEDLRDVHRSAAQRIAELRSGWEVIRSAERLEEDVEAARVLTLDARRLAEAAREPGGPGERAGATIEGPLESLIEESARIYADLALLAEESPDDTPLAALARAIQSTLLAELDEARRAAATGDHQVLASRLEELRRGFGRRRPDLTRELEKARGAARRVRSELDPRPSPAKRVETIAGELRAAASSEARVPTSSTTGIVRVVLDESRRALAEIAFLLGRAEAFSYDDFESAISLEALRDLLGRAAEESLEALVQPGDGDGRTEVLAGRAAFLDELARHFRRTGPLRQLGRAVQLVDGLAEAAESIVWTLRGARAWNPRELGRIARRTRDVAEGVDATRAELRAHLAMAGDAPWKGQLAKSLDGLRESESALESSVRSLVGTSLAPGPALDAARREASRAARLLGDASRAIEELRTDSLAEARAALGWLEERLGDPPQRIARLASAQRELAERAAATPAARRQEIAALAVTQAAHRLEASGLGRELQRGGPQGR